MPRDTVKRLPTKALSSNRSAFVAFRGGGNKITVTSVSTDSANPSFSAFLMATKNMIIKVLKLIFWRVVIASPRKEKGK